MIFLAQALATSNTVAILQIVLMSIKQLLALIGALVILAGALYAVSQFVLNIWRVPQRHLINFDTIRLTLGRAIILGLEFIIAADVIETTTTPDYYALGILGLLVVLRTFLNFSLNKDLNNLMASEMREKEISQKGESE
jgi:uncharacterized membrane protein